MTCSIATLLIRFSQVKRMIVTQCLAFLQDVGTTLCAGINMKKKFFSVEIQNFPVTRKSSLPFSSLFISGGVRMSPFLR